jgi:hypothetical protein
MVLLKGDMCNCWFRNGDLEQMALIWSDPSASTRDIIFFSAYLFRLCRLERDGQEFDTYLYSVLSLDSIREVVSGRKH